MTRATSRHQKLIDNVETLVNKWESIEPRRSNISRVTPLVTNLREETGIHIFGRKPTIPLPDISSENSQQQIQVLEHTLLIERQVEYRTFLFINRTLLTRRSRRE
ncbi:Protein CBG26792 [Caenorhabditis briggsae]|uniref:Protein CBG26792 n=1 Tax=Caenorhabditis briggsae TaxID=6238 RepID=B6IHA4_CAEBR|nr:Protein CBG26792 [Caenorhabditis briggsae]CAR99284.1 Protein CBG26792 [Caenorhabditis briggsae]